MHVIVLRPDGACTRLSFRVVLSVTVLLVAAMLASTLVAYWFGQQQGNVAEILLYEEGGESVLTLAEREAAHEGLQHLAQRVVALERRLARTDLRIRTVGESLELDLAGLVPSEGGQGGAEWVGPESPMVLDGRLLTLERLLLGQRETVSLIDGWLREEEMREALYPHRLPVTDETWISSAFGYRNDPFTGERRFHSGMDFAGREGAEILASGDGIVVFSARRGAYGETVEIDHGGGLRTRYAHNSKRLVEVGQRVAAGDPIARMGDTGRATASHLHYEVLKQDRAVNPYLFLPDSD